MIKYKRVAFSTLVGKTLAKCVREGDDSISFETVDGVKFLMEHMQDCCENVSIESVIGELSDLIGSPILMAEEVSQIDEDADESATWTFYKLATIKGYVDIRWYGASNGYYSESVDLLQLHES